jgi:hypothetical protein
MEEIYKQKIEVLFTANELKRMLKGEIFRGYKTVVALKVEE